MSRRLLGLCVLAYPRARRQVDGTYVRHLALELADNHGVARQAVSLLFGGLRERIELDRSSGAGSMIRTIAVASVALAAVATVGGIALAGSSDREEVGAHSCVETVASFVATRAVDGDVCAEIERLAAVKERQGWDCTSRQRVSDGRRLIDLQCRIGS